MPGVEYKVLLDGTVVNRAVYDMIETITVELGIDLAGEARIELELCIDDRGRWKGVSADYTKAWQRMRIEVKNGSSPWVPLIEGPIVARSSMMSSEPGQSMLTLVVRDDSVYLNKQAKVQVFEGKSDRDVARKLLTTSPLKRAEVDEVPDRPKDRKLQHVQCCTEIELLRDIADPYDMHVYVKPGAEADQTVGYMKALDPKQTPAVPALVLVGPRRNIESFHVRDVVGNASTAAGAQLDIEGMKVTKKTMTWTENVLVGDDTETAADAPKDLGQILVNPIFGAFHNLAEVLKRIQQRNSYTVTASGTILGGCYDGVLRPYETVEVGGVDTRQCTRYVVKEVTHSLGRSEYRQDFILITNAVAKLDRDGAYIPGEIQ